MLTDLEVAYLAQLKPKRCPACDGDSLGLAERLYALVEMARDGGRPPNGQSWPAAVISCNDCGYLLLFDVRKHGIITYDHANRSI